MASELFIMKHKEDGKPTSYALRKWLSDRDFDTYTSGWKDRRGNDGISLRKGKEKRGVIICLDNSAPDALEVLNNVLNGGSNEQK